MLRELLKYIILKQIKLISCYSCSSLCSPALLDNCYQAPLLTVFTSSLHKKTRRKLIRKKKKIVTCKHLIYIASLFVRTFQVSTAISQIQKAFLENQKSKKLKNEWDRYPHPTYFYKKAFWTGFPHRHLFWCHLISLH